MNANCCRALRVGAVASLCRFGIVLAAGIGPACTDTPATQLQVAASARGGDANPPGSSDVGSDVEQICLGAAGCPCLSDNDCAILCIETPTGRQCAAPCVPECEQDFKCAVVPGPGADQNSVCVWKWGRLCEPCEASAACDAFGSPGAACIDYGGLDGAFCGAACATDADCPSGYACGVGKTIEGAEAKHQCLRQPESDGRIVCPCDARAVQETLATLCQADVASGVCSGERRCTKDGLSPCSASAVESCDGIDNDCNGLTDDVVCDDQNVCTNDLCDVASKACKHTNNGASCDDGNPCIQDGLCSAGVCGAGKPVNCDDANPCTIDGCGPTGCRHVPQSATACSDGNPCTVSDVCQDGACAAGKLLACDDGNPCTVDGCDASTGLCTVQNGAQACDDGNACTEGDTCSGGSCLGKAVACDDENPCTTDFCSPSAGCVHQPNTLPCNDGNACTFADKCQGGACLAGAPWDPASCDDGNPCTTKGCDPKFGCTHTFNSGPCDDGNPCTKNDLCMNGSCTAGENTCSCVTDADCAAADDGNACNGVLSCDKASADWKCKINPASVVVCDPSSDNVCAKNTCDPGTGKCGLVAQAEGKPCDADGSVCTVGDACQGGTCVAGPGMTCDDGNGCTTDVCDPSQGCKFVANMAPCSDGNGCTIGDVCQANACVPGPLAICDDNNPCTTDSCDAQSGTCVSVNNAAGCDDGNGCTQNDTCAGGKCDGPAVDCDDKNLCTTDSCDPKASCVHQPNTVACDDGNACTTFDACGGGTCKGQAADVAVLCDDGNPCTADTCSAQLGCLHAFNAATCDDGNPCTTGDVCAAGACQGGTNTCGCLTDADCATQEDGNLCNGKLFCDRSALPFLCKVNPKTVVLCDTYGDTACLQNQCDPLLGTCAYVAIHEDKPCDADQSVCTQGDACKSGLCEPGPALPCSDGNACTTDTCDAVTGCVYTANGQACDDGNPCTLWDTCKNLACVPGGAVQCDDANPCTSDACDKTSGACVHTNNQVACSDANACTSDDVCEDGKCTGTTVVCDDKNLCTTDSCDPGSGCVNSVNNLACDDGNACTQDDTCVAGSCNGAEVSAQVLCDDQNPCTTDSCDPKDGCGHTNNSLVCDDGNPCTVGDVCLAGACQSGTNTCSCDSDADCAGEEDGNLCNGTLFCNKSAVPFKCVVNPKTVVTCDAAQDTTCGRNVCAPASGKCLFTAQVDGKPCDADASVCTVGDACKAGTCAPGAALDCDDGNTCSDDACDGKSGCVHVANHSPCSDGNACTLGDTCVQNGCVAGVQTACNDHNPCTNDVCDASTGACIFASNTLPCDDGNACSQGDVCAGGICGGAPVVCDDKNLCTSDTCNPSTGCVNTPNSVACNDGNLCTIADVCGGGVCKGQAVDPAALCNDNNPCTTDSCSPKLGCVASFNSAPCDDGNGCTIGDTCSGGSCASGTNTCACAKDADCAGQEDGNLCNGTLFCDKSNLPYQCKVNPKTVVACDPSQDNACRQATCAPATGACVLAAINESKPCNADGSVCSLDDACKSGVCMAGPAMNCNDNNVCTDDACDALTGCTHKANAAPCSDGNACTIGDGCQNAGCASGYTQVCNDNNVCTTDSCNATTGTCVFANNAGTCDDGNACSQGDTCTGGACIGTAVSCDDKNLCTSDACDAKTGCSHTPNSLPCNDGNACTQNDVCAAAACKGAQVDAATFCDDGNPCTSDACNPASGCVHAANTASCDDGNGCTVGDTCAGGSCHSGTNTCGCVADVDCAGQEDGNLCNGTLFCDKSSLPYMCRVNPKTVVTCDATGDGICTRNACVPATGLCGYVSLAEGKPCNADNSVCSVGDACTAGVCLPGPLVSCDDGNPCTDDGCDPATGCTHKANVSPCSDGNPCTIGDVCALGGCMSGQLRDCNDQNPCTTDSCSAASGQCVHLTNSAPCNDGNACTQGDTCSGGACAGTALVCDDKNPCTSDACDAQKGCVLTANTMPCNDNNACTDSDQCAGGTCAGTVTKSCNDSNPCTNDSCDPASGCVHAANAAACDDGNACTQYDSCANSACAGTAFACNDNNLCTSDSCNPLTGCVFVANSLPCDDGNACTAQDKCAGKVCAGTLADPVVLCSDGNPCTTDACDAKLGCLHSNNTAACDDGNGCTTGDVCAAGKCQSGTNTCACSQDADCAGQEDGNFCNGTLFCDKTGLPYKCKVNPITVVTCDASGDNVCRTNVCTPATGKCAYVALNEGKACDADGSVCTPTDTCVSAVCKPGAALNCDDGNACTTDSCDAKLGCTHVAATGSCSDGNACTVGDVCKNAACTSGAATVCNDGNACTDDSCNTTSGLCVFNAAPLNGAGCNADNSVCTVADTCSSGSCVAGAQLNCDDKNLCTSDGCLPASGCTHTPNTAPCNDNNLCTGPDVCAGGVCQPAAINCDDANPCTIDTCDSTVGCKHVALQDKTSCGPTNYCFGGLCKDGKCGDGIVTALLGEQCDDGNILSGDGCSATCQTEDTSCASGVRAGMLDFATYPKIAQCNGNWSGSIGSLSPAALCGAKFHVCNSSAADQVLLQTIAQAAAFQPGCWSINAANDNGTCHACTNTQDTNDIAGLGKDCQGKITNFGNSCISPNYRIDSMNQTCVRNAGTAPWILGVVCCSN